MVAVGVIVLPLAAMAALPGCAAPPEKHDLTSVLGSQAALANQATPTEIQAAVMAFADKYTSRAAGALDLVHDQSESAKVRRFARQAKMNLGLGALTIACEVNPVASLLDIVALARLQRRSFTDHWAPTLSPEHARAVQAMYELSERDAWALAARFLTERQSIQLRELIDDWYRSNPEARYTSHVRLIDFAAFRRESAPTTPYTPGSVLALLRIDPMSGMDPVVREVQESRLIAERALYFAARVPPLLTWQAQRMTADLLVAPEVQGALTSTERVRAAVDQLPKDVEGVLTRTSDQLQKAVANERDAAIRQADAAVTAQREALTRDIDAREERVRALLGDVKRALAAAGDVASGASESANRTIKVAQASSTEVIDHACWRALVLVCIALVGVPVVLIGYRLATSRLFAVREPSPAPPLRPRRL